MVLPLVIAFFKSLNLNGNEFEDVSHIFRKPLSFLINVLQYEKTSNALLSMTNLKSLHINLHEEDQVDLVMRTLEHLQELNGLPVERDLIEGEGESEEEEDGQYQDDSF